MNEKNETKFQFFLFFFLSNTYVCTRFNIWFCQHWHYTQQYFLNRLRWCPPFSIALILHWICAWRMQNWNTNFTYFLKNNSNCYSNTLKNKRHRSFQIKIISNNTVLIDIWMPHFACKSHFRWCKRIIKRKFQFCSKTTIFI